MSYQNITIVGRVGRNAELKYLKDGVALCEFSVAVSKKTGRGDERKEKTTWFKCTVWRDRAETAADIIRKGAQILVAGEVDIEAYIDKKTNEPRASLTITVGTFQLLSPKAENDEEHAPAATAPHADHQQRRDDAQRRNLADSDDLPF